MENLNLPLCWWRMSTPSCAPEELTQIITAPNSGFYSLPSEPYNEVYDGIYISDGVTALSMPLLQSLGITHIVNAACGKDVSLNLINTSPEFYREYGIEFLGIESLDHSSFPLLLHFEKAANFIANALTNDGTVLVHCREGISRSATIVLAYLMIKANFTVQEAVRTVRKRRDIIPNCGFLKQLCALNEILIEKRKNTGDKIFISNKSVCL